MSDGFFAIGISHCKTEHNIGSLWRSAELFGAAFVFTVGRRYRRQPSDTMGTTRNVPLFHYDTVEALHANLPHGAPLVGVELDERAIDISSACHPRTACYLLGAEDHGLTNSERDICHLLLQLPGKNSMNVACAGSIVMYDRTTKLGLKNRRTNA